MAVASIRRKNARMILYVGINPDTGVQILKSYNFQIPTNATPNQIFNSVSALGELTKHQLYDIEQVETSSIY